MANVDLHTLTADRAEADITMGPAETLELVELYLIDGGVETLMATMEEVSSSGNTFTYRYDFMPGEAASGETYKAVASWITEAKAGDSETIA